LVSSRIGVLALQGDVREHLRALDAVGAHPVAVRRPTDLEGIDGIVIPGGESTTIGQLAATFGVLEPLRAQIRDGLPAFGSCAGMILLAERVLDGRPDQQLIGGLDVTVRRNAYGRQVDSFEEEVDVTGVGRLRGVFIRAPWVVDVGPQVQVLAEHADKIVAVRQGRLLATAFHPELAEDARVHRYFLEVVKGS
jgi:5'-phosphate synthase pdxT subunit